MSTYSEQLAQWLASLDERDIPEQCQQRAGDLLLDSVGLAVAARRTDYMAAMAKAWDEEGPCTVIGQSGGHDVASAAVLNGAAIHGEDFDDTFEGAPLHAGAVAIPALLAVCERHCLSGHDFFKGLVAALETQARLALVAPGAIHLAGFQPAPVIGCLGAAAGVAVALRLEERAIGDALGIAASFSSGLMEFLVDGAWTKRVHPGWAAQAGYKAARMAKEGVSGPRTVLEGDNGFFRAFAPSVVPDFARLTTDLGIRWRMDGIIFKLYPCGTPIGPYIDCGIMISAAGIKTDDIEAITCAVAEPVIRRQWAPIEKKRKPANGFAAKFSGPFGVALGMVRGRAGLEDYTDQSVSDRELMSVTEKIHCEIDADSSFPQNYEGRLRVLLKNGASIDFEQPHLRGGSREPLHRDDLERKFFANTRYGGWSESDSERLKKFSESAFAAKDFDELKSFRI